MIPGLPYDAEIEYLESTGTQWIDTGFIFGADNGFSITYSPTNADTYVGNSSIFGSRTDGGNTRMMVGFNANTPATKGIGCRVYVGWGVLAIQVTDTRIAEIGSWHTATANISTATATDGMGATASLLTLPTQTRTAYIFGANTQSGPLLCCSRIAACEIYQNGVLIRDFIPVRFTNEHGVTEGAMYDRVSRRLFRNKGTGSFIRGPDVATPVMGLRTTKSIWTNPYVTDGLIAMWDGEWNAGGGLHDAAATTWVDISGNNRDAALSGTYSWGANYWHVESVSRQGLATWPAQNLGTDQTIEFVIEASDRQAYGRVIAEGQGVASPILREGYLYMFGYGMDRGPQAVGYDVFSRHVHQITHVSGGPMLYYIDGNLVWTANDATANSTGATVGYFANRSDYMRGIDADYFTMRRYNRVLTAAEIAHNYAVDRERFGLN